MPRGAILLLVAATAGGAVPAVCSAAEYTIKDLGTFGGGASSAAGINASGQVTGFASVAGDQAIHAFLYDGTLHDLGTLGGDSSRASAINASGQVIGYSQTPRPDFDVFLYSNGALQDLGPTLSATSINAAGQIALTIYATQDPEQAYIYDGTLHDLGTLPGGSGSIAFGINDSGQVTGAAGPAAPGDGHSHAFIYDATHGMVDVNTLPNQLAGAIMDSGNAINANGAITGTDIHLLDYSEHAFYYDGAMHELNPPGSPKVIGEGKSVNASGQVVGLFTSTIDGSKHALFYDQAHGAVDLNTLIDPASGWYLEQAIGINDSGQIAGDGLIDGQRHAFLLTPIPEPSTAALALIAAGVLAASNRRLVGRFRRAG